MTKKPFNASQFTATDFYTDEDKARFANHFIKFVLSGFRRTMFYKWFYKQLSNCFGHIAHYNIDGFYAHFFKNPEDMLRFIEHTRDCVAVGDPHYTFSDVERAIQGWIILNEDKVKRVLRQQNEQYREKANAEEKRLAALHGKSKQTFIVAQKSQNVGSFGHYGYIMIAEDSSAWEVCRTSAMPWKEGERVQVPLGQCQPNWASVCVETPRRLPNAPEALVKQFFGEKVA